MHWPCKKAGGGKTEAISAGSSRQSKIQCVGGLEEEENILPVPSLGGLLNVRMLGHLVMSSKPILGVALKGPCTTCYSTKERVGAVYHFFKAEELAAGQDCSSLLPAGECKEVCA